MLYYSQEHQNKFQIGFCKPDFGIIKGRTGKKQANIMDGKSQNLVTQFSDESKIFSIWEFLFDELFITRAFKDKTKYNISRGGKICSHLEQRKVTTQPK